MPKNTTEPLPGVDGPGVAPKKLKILDAAVDEWRDIVDKRVALTKQEVEALEVVVNLMRENNITAYQYGDDQQVVLTPGTEKVKVKTMQEAAEQEED
jgi:tRNA isopentenyl-2-thiomethyl-A-37 hydroxylase MiaE